MSPRAPQRRRAAAGRGRKGNVAAATIPTKQWDYPAGLRSRRNAMATLREVTDPAVATRSIERLPLLERARLVVERLERQKELDLVIPGAGHITRERAIQEVRVLSEIGLLVIDVEQRLITGLIREAARHAVSQPRGRKRSRP